MAGVIQKPDSLSLSGNINKFILAGSQPVSFVLKKGDTVLLESEYMPGADNLLDIDIRDVVESCLSYKLDASNNFYVQADLVATFTATIDKTDYTFRVIRGGVANLADTAVNWLKLHFLTWQPRVKAVTYYSPEWLTYYAVEECSVKLKATYPDKSTKVISLGTCVAGHATTMNLQYSVVAGKLGNTYPSFYEVWTEKSGGTKLSESQVYAFSDMLSEDEQWYLFENSLGGIDTFRAYGSNNLNAEHEHSIAQFGDVREEYEVDTQRKYVKNTGYLDDYSRRWLLDFFPSKAKFVYEATAIRKIVVTESDVTYVSNELPSSYTFTWQLAEVSPFLNLVKNSNDIPDNLVAPDLSSPDFILPPRLAEFPRVTLSEGVLIPAFDPFNPKPTVTTFGAIQNTIKNAIVKELEDEIGNIGGGSGGGECNLEIIESTDEETIPTDFNLYSALKSKMEDEKKAQEMENKYIRKDKPDETDYRVDFHDGITAGHYVGGFLGDGALIDKDGNSEMTSLKLREFLEVPELRFNRIDVVSGELWNAIAFGLIEEVDEVNRIVKLKLEDGELSGMHLSDFCRGIFHNLTDNETAPGVDSSGFDVMVGFSTSYFTPVEIIDNACFKYELKPGTTVHPCKSMKFAVYGNPVDKNRQASAYHTRTYTRYLRGVNTWKIEAKHISMQLGDLSNLTINGESLAEGSVYLNNVYFGGNVWHTPGAIDSLKGSDAYSVTLSTYSAVYNIANGIYEQAEVISGDNKVVTSGNQVIASQFNVSTRLQVSKGAEQLRFSEQIGEGKYIVESSGTNCTYVITDGLVAVKEVTADKAEIRIEVNCEGMAVYDVIFTIVRVADGKDGKDYEYIYTRTASQSKPASPATSPTDDYVPEGWTDDSVGPTLELPFEWVCKRVKREGTWGEYSTPSLWARFGEDGTDYEYIYTRTASQSKPATPATSQNNDYVPSGWTDDPVGPTSQLPFEWVCKRTKVDSVWGVFSIPALWSKFAEDGTDHEFIYRRTTTYSTPSTPATSQNDDFVPTDWTDNPVGVSVSYPYEWMSKRDKNKGIWGAFSTPSLWAKYGQDGNDGKPGVDGRYTEDRYKRSETQPTVSGNPPAGWSLDPPTSGTGPIWVIRATFNGDGTLVGNWSTPVKWTGSDGKDGKDGPQGSQGIPGTSQYFHVKYSASSNGNPMFDTPNTYIGTAVTSSPSAPTSYTSYKWVQLKGSQGPKGEQGIAGTPGADGRTPYLHIKYSDNGTTFTSSNGETPGAWIGQYVDFTSADSSVFSRYTWSKIKGEKGETGPAITYRGIFSSTKQYVGNSLRTDVVKHGDYWYIAETSAGAFSGQTPSTTSSYWKRLQGQFESIATGLLIAEQANIAGWRFKENYIESQNSNVVLNGAADATPKIALGAGYASRNNAPTQLYDDGRVYSSKLYAQNGCYIGSFKIEGDWLTGMTSGGADDSSSKMQLQHTKNSDGSFSKISLGSNVNNSLWRNQRVTGRIYNGISNKSDIAEWGYYYRNTALQLEANFADVNLALETIGGRMHRGKLWEIEEISHITGGGTYNPLKNGSVYVFRDMKEDLTFELPTHARIQEIFGNFQSGISASSYGFYTIRILIDRYNAYRVLVVGTSTTPLLNHNGDIQNDASGVSYGARWMSKGDFMVLTFYNKAWYIQSFSN